MWVSKEYYPHIIDFVREAQAKGVCKRVPNVPDIKTGVSRCYLLHRDGGVRPRCFGYFVIADLAILVTPETRAALAEKYGSKALMKERSAFPDGERDCGEMKVGGCYMVSASVFEEAKKETQGTNVYGDLVLLPFPFPKLPREYPNLRGISYIEREAFLGGLTWYNRG